jgi:hypothetical protein
VDLAPAGRRQIKSRPLSSNRGLDRPSAAPVFPERRFVISRAATAAARLQKK